MNCSQHVRDARIIAAHGRGYNLAMSHVPNTPVVPIRSAPRLVVVGAEPDKVLCERCGTEMFRMHAVWRCPACRFKTDCCGW